ncbi:MULTISPECIES: hypothetical protein [Brucella/Ochrobactrum group]|uniref:hypothetical protein n=1 Tax=Brucella/Ochrobactrum group TaxID=2826938 RepID=UPI000A41C837|nr:MULTISPECIES: hypothetical protein [Brucella/Ochrobactrum group]MCQ9148110.1 hypothetical protein [Ochrobactrum sp. BTU2]UGQ22953.1 hypothetical protein LRL11_20745 [Brucella anthropi]
MFAAQRQDGRLLPVDLSPEPFKVWPDREEQIVEDAPIFGLVRARPPAHPTSGAPSVAAERSWPRPGREPRLPITQVEILLLEARRDFFLRPLPDDAPVAPDRDEAAADRTIRAGLRLEVPATELGGRR